jgi:hypothetical protein
MEIAKRLEEENLILKLELKNKQWRKGGLVRNKHHKKHGKGQLYLLRCKIRGTSEVHRHALTVGRTRLSVRNVGTWMKTQQYVLQNVSRSRSRNKHSVSS